MRIKKYFCAVTAALTLLAGCGSSTYERDTSAGEIKEITLSQMDTMFTQGKDLCEAVRLHTSGFFDASGSTM